MAKTRTKFICSSCGFESPKWLGKCPSCGEWNTFSEEIEERSNSGKVIAKKEFSIVKLNTIGSETEKRFSTNIPEFDRVLGGGILPGSVILLGGDPGIGKSTLVMQAAAKISGNVLYVTGEESIKQIAQRANRLKVDAGKISALAETDINTIITAAKQSKTEILIIDSIQTMFDPKLDNAPGTVTQIRECTAELMNHAKAENYSVIIVGHVTKDGIIAGPKVLEHIVDTVLQFEGEKNHSFRILRAQKNRFGSTNEIGIFEMHDTGLTEVKNPSEVFLNSQSRTSTGSVITASMEGSRPVLFEVQALVTPSNFGNPQRVATGFDYRRLSILLAVLEKRAGLRLSAANVYLNMAGGIRIDEPAVDIAVCISITSSLKDAEVKKDIVAVGEVGLGGEIRSISNIEKRIQEAEKLGLSEIIVPASSIKNIKLNSKIKLTAVKSIEEALAEAFK